MTTYVLYNKASNAIVRIDSSGSATAEGPDRGPEAYSNDPAFVVAHAVWKVPVEFFTKLRIDVLHGIGSHANVVSGVDGPVGIRVHDRPTLEARRKAEARQALIAEMAATNAQRHQLTQLLLDNPFTETAEIQALVDQQAVAETNSFLEYQRVVGGGAVPLTPILDSRAGEEILL